MENLTQSSKWKFRALVAFFIGLGLALSLPAFADYILNPFTKKLDYFTTSTSTSGSTSSLAQVTAIGATTTQTLQLFGGFLAASSTVTSTFTVVGGTSLQGVNFTVATGTSATTTNLFSTNGSFTNLTVTNPFLVSGITWTNATGTNTTSTNLSVTNGTITNLTSGNASLSGGSINGTTIGASSPSTGVFTNATATFFNATNGTFSNLTITNPLTLTGIVWTNATGTNTTSTNLNVTTVATLPSNTTINGTAVCLSGGVNCTVPTLQAVTNSGSTSNVAVNFYGGLTTSNLTATGTTSLQNTTFTIATGTSVTTTNLFATNGTITNGTITTLTATGLTFTSGTGTNVTSTSLSITGSARLPSNTQINNTAVCLSDGTNCPSSSGGTLQSVTAAGSTTTIAVNFYGGLTTSNLTATGTTSLQTFTFTNGTGTSATTTNLFSTNGNFTNLLWTNTTGTNTTSTNDFITNGVITNLTSSNITLTGGTMNGVAIGGTTPSTSVFTNSTSTNLFATSAQFTSLTVTGLSSLQTLTFTNGTGTNVTSTSAGFTTFITTTGTIRDIVFSSATATILMPANGTITLNDLNGLNLMKMQSIGTNYGASFYSGAFISRNSTYDEEFNNYRKNPAGNCSATTNNSRGDYGTPANPCATRTGELTFNINTVGAQCIASSLADTPNGVERVAASSTFAGTSAACVEFQGADASGDAQFQYAATSLPTIIFKVRPSLVSSTTSTGRFFVGLSDVQTAASTMPTNGMFFSNCNDGSLTPGCESNWIAVVKNGLSVTTSTCAGQAIDTTNFAFLRIEVRSSTDVHFFVDGNTSNGIAETECGGGFTTSTSVTPLTQFVESTVTAAGLNESFDIDYIRSWQDDAPN